MFHNLSSTRLASTLLAAALVIAAASGAVAQSLNGMVHRSGNAYHVAVCLEQAAGTARCHAHLVTDIQGAPKENGRNAVGLPAGFGPSDLRGAYNVGAGSSTAVVAIVDAYGYSLAESDLAVYRSTYGLPPCTTASGCFTKLNQNGQARNYPRDNTGWAQETALDLDMVSAMCPTCRIVLVEANSPTFANLAAAENVAAGRAHVVSNSYGGGESGSQPYEGYYNHPDVAITVSSGDSGYGVQFPASSPHVTAVGGTTLTKASNTRGWSEVAWSGAGSGCSAIYLKQTWQVGVTDANCVNNRMEADVSAVADPATGVAVYGPASATHEAWLVFGGTSVAAPLVAGLYGANGGPVKYGSDPYNNTVSLHDVTSGSNATPSNSCGGLYLCTAGVGYDGPTGLGTPNGVTPF
ncbi:S53 family peptidase [Phenylobacterium sp.]|jgi:hypothetical protein|uniref:S53 family peptidase n=1 Tax=Phenylobacterium sp. TaxID=1871053 RepID=UPI002F41D5CF